MSNSVKAPLRYVIAIVLLCLVGLANAGYLAWLHYQVHTNPAFHSFCAMNDSLNCETVAQSPYAVFAALPVAVWGIVGYLLMLALALCALRKENTQSALAALVSASIIAVGASSMLAYISYRWICSLCIMCSFVYIVNLLIFFILLRVFFNAGLSFRESIVRSYKDALLNWPWLGLVLVMIGFLWYSFPSYWVKADVNGLLESPHGTTEKGYPWIGAEDPELVIEEYSDYFCPYCKRAHFLQRQIVRGNQGRVRLVHRHFPLDEACNPLITRPFHPGACLFAKAAICAKSQGKFWEINDSLYSRESLKGETWEAKINSAARGVGLNLSQFGECLSSDTAHKELREDIDEGLFLQLQGTPSFVVDSKVYVGGLDEEVFRQYGLSNPLAQD